MTKPVRDAWIEPPARGPKLRSVTAGQVQLYASVYMFISV